MVTKNNIFQLVAAVLSITLEGKPVKEKFGGLFDTIRQLFLRVQQTMRISQAFAVNIEK